MAGKLSHASVLPTLMLEKIPRNASSVRDMLGLEGKAKEEVTASGI